MDWQGRDHLEAASIESACIGYPTLVAPGARRTDITGGSHRY